MGKSCKRRRLSDGYCFAGFRTRQTVRGVFGEPDVRIVGLDRRSKKRFVAVAGTRSRVGTTDAPAGPRFGMRGIPDRPGARRPARRLSALRQRETRAAGVSGRQSAFHQTICLLCGTALRAGLDPRCGQGAEARLGHGQDAGDAVHAGADRAGGHDRRPKAIGIDEISVRKRHTYRIVVSDLHRRRPIWFGGEDRSEASMAQFYAWLGPKKSGQIRLAVMDMWKPFRNARGGARRPASRHSVRQVPHHAPSR